MAETTPHDAATETEQGHIAEQAESLLDVLAATTPIRTTYWSEEDPRFPGVINKYGVYELDEPSECGLYVRFTRSSDDRLIEISSGDYRYCAIFHPYRELGDLIRTFTPSLTIALGSPFRDHNQLYTTLHDQDGTIIGSATLNRNPQDFANLDEKYSAFE